MLWFNTMCVLAQACAMLERPAQCAVLYHLLLPYRGCLVQVGMASCWGLAEHYLGLLATAMADFAAAEKHFEAARAGNAARGLAHAERVTQDAYAAMLLMRGDAERALALLRAALPGAEAAGTSRLAARILARIDTAAGISAPPRRRLAA
jgi:tetratricopeptide (TPR) repeat protein